MTIKESLNILDTKAIDGNGKFLDLRNLYEAANLDYEKKKKLKELIDKNEDPEVIAAYMINNGDDSTLDESILTEDDLHDVFRKDAKNQYKSFSSKLDAYNEKAKDYSELLKDFPDINDKETVKVLLGDEPKFKLDKGYNHLERQNFPYYVTHYEGTSFYHPEEGGYYVGGLEPDWSEGFESFEEAVSALGDYLEENNSARVSFNPRNVSVMDDNYAYEDSTEDYEEITDNKGNVIGAVARGKYIGEEDQIWVESNKEYLSRQSGDRMYESFNESYKLRFYKKQKGLNQGNLDHEEFFDTKADAVNRYKEVFDRNAYSLNPTVWVGDGDSWKRLSEIEINESLKRTRENMKFKNKKKLTESVESPEFSAFITNLGKYNEGELIGEWVQFPIDEDDFEEILKKIGIGSEDEFGQPYEEWFVTDYECNLNGFDWQELGEYPSYETLQEFGELVNSIDDVEAVDNAYEVTNDLKEAIEGLESGDIIFYRGFSNFGDFAEYWIDEVYGGVENLDQDTIERYFDYEALGRDLSFDSYESEDEDGNEVEVSAGEYFCGDENASDYEVGEEYVNQVGFDGVGNPEYYFDFDMFGRDFEYDNFTLTSNGVVEYR